MAWEKVRRLKKKRLALSLFLSSIEILTYGENAADEYGKIRAALEKSGTPIGGMDMLIASHAKAENLILVTNNTKEFIRVPQIKLENWVM